MDQQAYLAIAAMLNSFPQGSSNPDLTMTTYEAVLRGASPQAIIEAAERFVKGLVSGQSKTFAPSIAEFFTEVTQRQEYIDIKAKPRLPPPRYFPGPLAPFQIKRQQRLAENSHRPVLFEDINFDQWRKLSANKEVPTGAIWVAALGIVYGPEPKHEGDRP